MATDVGLHTITLNIGFQVTKNRGEGKSPGFVKHNSETEWENAEKDGVLGIEAAYGQMFNGVLDIGKRDQ